LSNGTLQIRIPEEAGSGKWAVDMSVMRPLVACRREDSPWLLLTVSILSCCHLPTTAEVTIESVPFDVFEGDNVLLNVHNLPENLLAFAWFKGLRNMKHRIALYAMSIKSSIPGPKYSSRETVYHNGSLWIYNVTHKDTGFYTLRTINRHARISSITTIHLYVSLDQTGMESELANGYLEDWGCSFSLASILICGCPPTSGSLTIESVPPNVAEGESVVLLVHNLPENLRTISWYKGVILYSKMEVARHIIATNSSVWGPAHSGREIVFSNGSLLLHNVTWKDIGFYTLRTLTRDGKVELVHVHLKVERIECVPSLSAGYNSVMIEQVPQNAAEGKGVLLQVQNLPEDMQTFSWYKGVYSISNFKIAEYNRTMNSITQGFAHSRRETVYTNGSLLLQNVTEKDSGFYTLHILNGDLKSETTHMQLYVIRKWSQPVMEPYLQVTDTTVSTQSSVSFACLSDDTGTSIRWIFNNRSLQLTERMTLSPTKCGLSIFPVRREDAGEYRCEVSNPVSSEISFPQNVIF
ncbi:carcinoembryonic antigen-related cell adhesion molecule 3-like isoform X2, partial [Sigmodon hispidus]